MIYIIATPIGNNQDISARALDLIKSADYLVCESFSNGSYWQKRSQSKAELVELSEHTKEAEVNLILSLATSSKQVVLISDGGTPVFADPGKDLLAGIFKKSANSNLPAPVTCVPGASSLTAAISLCPFNMEQFIYLGFLSRESKLRKKQILKHARCNLPLIIFDTPYRLKALANDIYQTLPAHTQCLICFELTTKQQELWLCSVKKMFTKFGKQNLKKRFVLIIDKPFFQKNSAKKI